MHLVRRFFGSLRPRPATPIDEAWAESFLTPAEGAVWAELPASERAYAIRVARHTEQDLAGTAAAGEPRWIAAALVHDVGKLDAHLGVSGRVVATLAGVVVSRDRAHDWAGGASGFRTRVGQYLVHDERGAVRLRDAGARPEVAAWAEVHHRPDRWPECGIPAPVCEALAAADDR